MMIMIIITIVHILTYYEKAKSSTEVTQGHNKAQHLTLCQWI